MGNTNSTPQHNEDYYFPKERRVMLLDGLFNSFECSDLHISYPYPLSDINAKNWEDLSANEECCKELHPIADSMAGSLLAPNTNDNCHIQLNLTFSHSSATTAAPPPIYLRFPNRFTPTTAFNLLHMLNHLDGRVIVRVGLDFWIQFSFPAASPFLIRCYCLDIDDIKYISNLQDLTAVFKPQEVRCRVENAQQMEDTIEQVGKNMPFPLSFNMRCSNQQEFERVIQYFRTGGDGVVSKVWLHLSSSRFCGWNEWPLSPFNPEEALDEGEGKLVFNNPRVVVEIKDNMVERVTIDMGG